MADVSLSSKELKALSSESRASILKALQERNHTLSELSAKLGMSAPTIKEHVSLLQEAGFAELIDEGRKWKYYSLTRKGRDVLGAKERQANIFIILSVVAVAALAGLLLSLSLNTWQTNQVGTAVPAVADEKAFSVQQIVPQTSEGETAEKKGPYTAAIVQPRCVPIFELTGTEARGNAEHCYNAPDENGCLGIDNYNSESKEFGKADGKPDCEWKAELAK